MLNDGILHPQLASLLARFRHANSIAILDAPFPTYPTVETIDLVLAPGIPTISQVLDVILPRLEVSGLVMAEEFMTHVDDATRSEYRSHHRDLDIEWVPHQEFKQRVAGVLGIVHTGDCVPYSNVIVNSL